MSPRNIEVKTLLNADEFVDLERECKAADVTRSKLLRDLAKGWMADRKDSRRQHQAERPAMARTWPCSCRAAPHARACTCVFEAGGAWQIEAVS